MLTAYPTHRPQDPSLKSAAWVDLLDPTDAERAAFEEAFGLHVPTPAELVEIESTSRLRNIRGALYMTAPLLYAADNEPWVLVSAGFHERGGQSKANAALADHLLARGIAVHLVGHDFDARFLQRSGCTVHAVRRPLRSDFLGVFGLRRWGRRVAKMVTRRWPDARVVVNGGCCRWDDINWVHYVHAAWMPLPVWGLARRMKIAATHRGALAAEGQSLWRARAIVANSEKTRRDLIEKLKLPPESSRPPVTSTAMV